MHGSEKVRFCTECNLNVYNLSGMTKIEAERLIAQREGRLCVRFYRRADGTILTDNCPVGLRALKRRLSRVANAVISMLLSFSAGVLAFAGLREIAPASVATQGTMVASPRYPATPERPLMMGSYAPDVAVVAGQMEFEPQTVVKKVR
jgi:hypothetical protein